MSFETDMPNSGAERAHAVARLIDISAVQARHGEPDVTSLAAEALAGDYVAAHVLPSWLPTLRRRLEGSSTNAGSPVGFPSGGTATAVKQCEAEWLIDRGVQELDIVINLGLVKSGDFAGAADDLRAVLAAVGGRVPTKVILEVAYLEGDELERAADAALDAGADWLKTGTGWAGRGTTVEHVSRLRAVAGDGIGIKASGGIRSLQELSELYDAGARRFGANTVAAKSIVREARR